jgi:hypothetical protein
MDAPRPGSGVERAAAEAYDAHRERVEEAWVDRHRIYLQPINYPTVPRGTERLRITPTPLHDDAAMDRFVDALRDVWARRHEIGRRSADALGRTG